MGVGGSISRRGRQGHEVGADAAAAGTGPSYVRSTGGANGSNRTKGAHLQHWLTRSQAVRPLSPGSLPSRWKPRTRPRCRPNSMPWRTRPGTPRASGNASMGWTMFAGECWECAFLIPSFIRTSLKSRNWRGRRMHDRPCGAHSDGYRIRGSAD